MLDLKSRGTQLTHSYIHEWNLNYPHYWRTESIIWPIKEKKKKKNNQFRIQKRLRMAHIGVEDCNYWKIDSICADIRMFAFSLIACTFLWVRREANNLAMCWPSLLMSRTMLYVVIRCLSLPLSIKFGWETP